jgi:ribosomal protein S18 acetylase RimI-like enzyme
MMLDGVQLARTEDLEGIAFVKGQTWPEEPVRRDLIALVLSAEDHCVQVMRANGKIAGFVDSFMTLDHEGNRRWEIDLLAVHPWQRGRHFGEQLVKASVEEGYRRKAAWSRALIGVENYASQVTFERCGFIREDNRLNLFVSRDQQASNESVGEGVHLLHVTTINYRGLWIEEHFEAPILAYASAECTRENMDLAGAVIPMENEESIHSTKNAGYELVGAYAWWKYYYND